MTVRLCALLVAIAAAVPVRRRAAFLAEVPAPSALVNSSALSAEEGGLSVVARAELQLLLRTLLDARLEPKTKFVPKCEKHVKGMVKDLDATYTIETLRAVILKECKLARKDPAKDSGFRDNKNCKEFACRLADCRVQEIKTGETAQYHEYCEDYYNHIQTEPHRPAPAAEGEGLHSGRAGRGDLGAHGSSQGKDSDGDGVPDFDDRYPHDKTRWKSKMGTADRAAHLGISVVASLVAVLWSTP